MIEEYIRHPEAKSLGPDGKPCTADTRGLFQRVHITAGKIRYIDKETSSMLAQGADLSVVTDNDETGFRVIEYGRKRKVTLPDRVLGRRDLRRKGIGQHTIEKALHGHARVSSYGKIAAAIESKRDGAKMITPRRRHPYRGGVHFRLRSGRMEIDRRAFLDSLGGAEAVNRMDSEARADALEHHMLSELNRTIDQNKSGDQKEARKYPTVAEVEAQIETRPFRQCAGFLVVPRTGENVKKLPPMPAHPTLLDFFQLRFMDTSNHVLQSANLAMKNGMSEEIILACLLHDVVQEIIRTDHGWWGAQLFEPYVSEKVSFAIRYHQALRYYPDPSVGYEYPDLYRTLFGLDYVPPPYIEATYEMVRKHKWYMEPRMVTVNDLYAFDPNAVVTTDPFVDVIGRHFKQPKEGLGNDNSSVAHMWRTIARPDQPL